MRRSWWGVFAAAAVFAGSATMLMPSAMSAANDEFVGTWSGTWEGSGSGRFDLTIERDASGQLAGGVSVGTDQGDYVAKFKELSFDGGRMKAKYDFTPDPQAEIVLSGTFTSGDAQGDWTMQPQGQNQAFAAGTWVVKKKG